MSHYPVNSSTRSTRSAFTLIELLIAMTLFVMVIAAGFACLKMGLGFIENSRHHSRSTQIMQSEIERVRSLPWDRILELPANDADVVLANEFSGSGYDVYTMQRVLSGSGDVRVVTLNINWTDISGSFHERTFKSQYTKGGLYDYIQ